MTYVCVSSPHNTLVPESTCKSLCLKSSSLKDPYQISGYSRTYIVPFAFSIKQDHRIYRPCRWSSAFFNLLIFNESRCCSCAACFCIWEGRWAKEVMYIHVSVFFYSRQNQTIDYLPSGGLNMYIYDIRWGIAFGGYFLIWKLVLQFGGKLKDHFIREFKKLGAYKWKQQCNNQCHS